MIAAYTTEVVPLAIRHWGPTYIHLTVVFGAILCSGVVNIIDS